MKTVILLLSCVVITFAEPIPYNITKVTKDDWPKTSYDINSKDVRERLNPILKQYFASRATFDINHVVDGTLELVNVIFADIDPIDIPGFSFELSIDNAFMIISLTNGVFSHLSSFHRNGDATISIEDTVVLSMPVSFEQLTINYTYGIELEGEVLPGSISISLDDLGTVIYLVMDAQTFMILDMSLNFDFDDVTFEFGEGDELNWLLSILIPTIVNIIRNDILPQLNTIIESIVDLIVNIINDLLS